MSSLREAWEEHAAAWTAWAREPHHDSYWRFHRDAFLELVPPPGRRTLDLGCGEGRLSRGDHRPLQDYVEALADAGLLIERLREPGVPEAAVVRERSRLWQRVPLFLHARTIKPG